MIKHSIGILNSKKYIKKAYSYPAINKNILSKILPTRFDQSISPKIIIGGMNKRLECLYDTGEYLAGKSTTIITNSTLDLKYIISILNSKLMSYFYSIFFKSLSLNGGYLRIGPPQLKKFPIKPIDKKDQKTFIDIVDNIIGLKYQGKCSKSLEKDLDSHVFTLYGLTQNEIDILERTIY